MRIQRELPSENRKKSIRIYMLCREYFGYASSTSQKQRRAFAWAIQDAVRVLTQCVDVGSWAPTKGYFLSKHSPLGEEFVISAQRLVPPETLKRLKSMDVSCHVKVPGAGLLIVRWTWLLSEDRREVLRPIFGKEENLPQELGLMKAVMSLSGTGPPFKGGVDRWSYIDLAEGSLGSIQDADIPDVPQELVLRACRRLLLA